MARKVSGGITSKGDNKKKKNKDSEIPGPSGGPKKVKNTNDDKVGKDKEAAVASAPAPAPPAVTDIPEPSLSTSPPLLSFPKSPNPKVYKSKVKGPIASSSSGDAAEIDKVAETFASACKIVEETASPSTSTNSAAKDISSDFKFAVPAPKTKNVSGVYSPAASSAAAPNLTSFFTKKTVGDLEYNPRVGASLNFNQTKCDGCNQIKVLQYGCPCVRQVYCTRECWLKSPHGLNRWEECAGIRVEEGKESKSRKVIARKDFAKGDTVYAELRPLVCGPPALLALPQQIQMYVKGSRPYGVNTCLSCCKSIGFGCADAAIPCQACGWLFCNELCAMDQAHSQAECRLFSSKNTPYPSFFTEYSTLMNRKGSVELNKIIYIIRVLFLKFSNQKLYESILFGFDRNEDLKKLLLAELAKGVPYYGSAEDFAVNLSPFNEFELLHAAQIPDKDCTMNDMMDTSTEKARRKYMFDKDKVLEQAKKIQFRVDVAEFWNIIRILRYYNCHVLFSGKEIAEMLAVLKRNSIRYASVVLGVTSLNKEGSYLLYEITSAVTHSCIPNAVVRINPSEKFSLVCTALDSIANGTDLSISINHSLFPLMGTRLRQLTLLKLTGSTCTCPRCSDPTENGTNLMRLKCSLMFTDKLKRNERCTEGLLPINPLNPYSDWKCQGKSPCCDIIVPYIIVKPILKSIENMVEYFEQQRKSLILDLGAYYSSIRDNRALDVGFLKNYLLDYHSFTTSYCLLPAMGPNHFLFGLGKMYGLLIFSTALLLHPKLSLPIEVFGNYLGPVKDKQRIVGTLCKLSASLQLTYDNLLPPYSYFRGVFQLYFMEGASRGVLKNKQLHKDGDEDRAGAVVLLSTLHDDSVEIKHMLRGFLPDIKEKKTPEKD